MSLIRTFMLATAVASSAAVSANAANPPGYGAVIGAAPGVGMYQINRAVVTRTYTPSNLAGAIAPGTTTYQWGANGFGAGWQLGWSYKWPDLNTGPNLNSFVVTYSVPEPPSFQQTAFPCDDCTLEAFPNYTLAVTAFGSWNASGYGNPRDHTFRIDAIEYSLTGASYSGQSTSNVYSVCCDPDVTGSASFTATRNFSAPAPSAAGANGEMIIRIDGSMDFGDAGAATIEIDLIFDPVGPGAFPCPASSYSITMPAQFPGASGGQFTVGVSAPDNCPWAAVKLYPAPDSGSDHIVLAIYGATNSSTFITWSGSQSVIIDVPPNAYPGMYLSTVFDIAGTRIAYTQPPTPGTVTGSYQLNRVEVKRSYGGPVTMFNTIGAAMQSFPVTALVLAYQAGWDFLWGGPPPTNHNRFVSVMNVFSLPAAVTPGASPPFKGHMNVDMHGDWLASGYGLARYHTLSTSGSAGTFDQEFSSNHCHFQSPTNDPDGTGDLQCDTNANVGSEVPSWPYPDSNGEIRLVQYGTTDFESAGTVTVEVDAVYTIGGGGFGSPLGFFPLTPCRAVDTRLSQRAQGPFGPPALAAYNQRNFTLPASNCGLPSTSQVYSLNFTVVPPGPESFLSTWPAGDPYPGVSTLNSTTGNTIANAALVPAGANGAIAVVAGNPTDLIVDANGYFAPPNGSELDFYLVTPCRVVDTRVDQGKTGPFGPPAIPAYSGGRDIPIPAGSCNIPASAKAYSLNFTVVPSGPLGFLSAWPSGKPYPGVSTLNSPDGAAIANAAIVPAGSNGAITVVAGNLTDLIIDINGYFGTPGGVGALQFYALKPCRAVDTRPGQGHSGAFGPPALVGSNATRDFPLLNSACAIPSSAKAYSLNITVIPQGPLAYLSIWPVGQPYPAVSTLNAPKGNTLANAAIVPAGINGGGITVLSSNPTDLIIDINGYFAP